VFALAVVLQDEHVAGCVVVLRIQLHRLPVVLDGQLRVPVFHVRFAETVVRIERTGIGRDVELEYLYRVLNPASVEVLIAQAVHDGL
jgi:hypothetical protein